MSGQNQNIIIQMQEVVKTYDTGDVPFTALSNVTIDIRQGEFLGITGKSGAGKTTLLNMIAGVSAVTSGKILFHWVDTPSALFQGAREQNSSPTGRGVGVREGGVMDNPPVAIQSLDEDNLARWRGEHLGIIYQSFELMPTLSLLQNVMLPPDFLGGYHPLVTKKRALELLEMVELDNHAYKIPAHISGGQKQRVAIARALVNDPHVIIADEPTGNLDSVTAETILQIFEQLVAQGKTIVMVTHDESFAPRFTRRLQIVDGVVSEPTGEVKKSNKEHVYILSADRPRNQGNETPAIVLRNVEKVYENAAGKFHALKNINLQLNSGQFISIVGKSGCGKSTLLNMVTGIDHPTTGDVMISNEHIYQMSESKRALWRGKNMGVVFQFFQLLPTLTLLENTMLPMDYCRMYPFNERSARAMELLKMVGLEDQAYKLPTAVSSGQQQCAAIARALATDPAIILADEPTGNLDTRSAETVLQLFESLAKQGKTILIVTHDPSITQRTDQTIILSDGEIIDPIVARALPFLSHPQMLAATKQAEKRKVAAGHVILKRGEAVDYFFIVVNGEVDIIMETKFHKEVNLTRLGPGQFFGEVELVQGGQAVAHVHAAEDGAELALIPRALFFELIDGSPLTRSAIHEVAANRRAEHDRRKNNR
jgi:ABC-type lipoprotein export system ATPase subunit